MHNLFLGAVDHVKLLVVLDADYELVGGVLDSAGNIAVSEVDLGEGHLQLEGPLHLVPLQLAKEHPIVSAEANLFAPRRHYDVENCVYFQRLRLQHLTHRIDFDNVNVAKVLAKNEEFLFDTIIFVFEELDIVDTLLKLLVVFLFEGVDVEDKEVSVVAADPGQFLVHSTAEEAVPRCLSHQYRVQVLVIHVKFVTLAARKDKSRIVCCSRRDEGASPIDNRLTTLHFNLAAEACRKI